MNILMIADNFPPNRDTASRRTNGLSTGLIQLGHSVTIISEKIQENDPRFDETFKPISNDRLNLKLATLNNTNVSNVLIYRLLDLLNPIKRQRKLYNAWVDLKLHDNKFDLIWATFPDHCSLAFAAYLSSKLDIPWVADFRDCYQDKLNIFQRLLLPVRKRAIKNVISSASAIVSVATVVSDRLKNIKPDISIVSIENAFDQKDFTLNKIYYPRRKKVNFVYTGTLEAGGQSLFPLLDGLARNKKLVDFEVKLEIFGLISQKFIKRHKQHQLGKLINFYGLVSREIAIKKTMEADVLISGHIMCSKIYDYIGAQRPILMTKSDFGEVEDLITENGIGWAPRSDVEMDAAIEEIFDMSDRQLILSINPSVTKKFEYKDRVIKLNNLFTKLVKSKFHKN